jgi:hypothetical protein
MVCGYMLTAECRLWETRRLCLLTSMLTPLLLTVREPVLLPGVARATNIGFCAARCLAALCLVVSLACLCVGVC